MKRGRYTLGWRGRNLRGYGPEGLGGRGGGSGAGPSIENGDFV
jgi:hypothetical protein